MGDVNEIFYVLYALGFSILLGCGGGIVASYEDERVVRMIQIYADGADVSEIRRLAPDDRIAGFTTNPTLAKQSGVTDYQEFIKMALDAAGGKPVSIEVLADDLDGMARQARVIVVQGVNAVVKIPVMNSHGSPTYDLIVELAREGIQLNVTAVFTVEQVQKIGRALRLASTSASAIVSVFAGRIADAWVDPVAHVRACRFALYHGWPSAQMLWASPRQSYDVMLAESAGCDIITLTPALIAKMSVAGTDLHEYSRQTAEMFHKDALAAGYQL